MLRRGLLAALPAALALSHAARPRAQGTAPGAASGRTVTVASTTSTEQSGLFGHILPRFEAATGIRPRVVALGTGQALDLARRGDADAVFVHDKAAEERFVAEGWSERRIPVMYNDFVVVGPEADPAGVRGAGGDVAQALRRIAEARAPFVSRGDRSGTHAAELRLWQLAGIDPAAAGAGWYREIGQGMGPALNTAAATDAYLLADRGTWISFRNRRALAVLSEGDPRLFNQYGVMVVSPARHPGVRQAEARAFADWLVSPAGQEAISSYRIDGQQLFFPNAGTPGA